jgi:hypothetical protein
MRSSSFDSVSLALSLSLALLGSACAPAVVVSGVVDAGEVPAGSRLALRWFASRPAPDEASGEHIDANSHVDDDGVHRLALDGVPEEAQSAFTPHEAGGHLVFVRDRIAGEPAAGVDVVAFTNTFVFSIEPGHAEAEPGWVVRGEVTSDACIAATESCMLECQAPDCFCGDCSDFLDRPLDVPAPLLVEAL